MEVLILEIHQRLFAIELPEAAFGVIGIHLTHQLLQTGAEVLARFLIVHLADHLIDHLRGTYVEGTGGIRTGDDGIGQLTDVLVLVTVKKGGGIGRLAGGYRLVALTARQ